MARASRRAAGEDSDEFAREDGDFDVASVLDATPVVRSLAPSR